jgi:manganese/zinc/iron transport system permease protein
VIHYNTLIVLIGTSLLGASAGLIGTLAVLRGRSLVGDALAHAALPGLCLAFLVLGERSLPAMLLGALVSGVLGVAIIAALRRWTRIKEDAAIGIVLSVFFGAGIVLTRLIQNWFETGSKAGLDSYILGKTAGMTLNDIVWVGGVSLANLLVVIGFYKELKLVLFDPAFARVQGWPIVGLDLLVLVLIAIAVVIGLPAVGVVLIAALLILPSAAARFWTERFEHMLCLATAFGLVIGLVGTALSARFSLLPAGPVIVLTGTVVFLVSMLFAPQRGALARLIALQRFRADLESGALAESRQ